MIENLTDLFLYEVAPDLNITGGGDTTPIQTC